ncbi:MAG: hypothetical protein ACM3SS_10685 [Rhodospirillaceae bacterium]
MRFSQARRCAGESRLVRRTKLRMGRWRDVDSDVPDMTIMVIAGG